MKKYNPFNLYLVGKPRKNGTYQYYLCEKALMKENIFVDIFCKIKIEKEDNITVQLLPDYYHQFDIWKFTRNDNEKVDKQELYLLLNEINYLKSCMELEEEMIYKELYDRDMYPYSKVFKNKTKTYSSKK